MFYVNVKTGRMTLPRDAAVAVLVSLTMHGIILFSCSLVLGQALSYDDYQPVVVSLTLPFPSGEGKMPSPAPAAAKKALFIKEVKKGAAESANLIREERVEPFSAKRGEERDVQPQEKGHGPQDVLAVGLTISSLGQKAEAGSTPAPGGILPYSPAKGRSPGGETFPLGAAQGNALGGEMLFPAYAKGDASAGSDVIFAAPRYGENSLPAYPLLARRRGYAGVVLLSAEILTDGSVGRVELKKPSGYELLDRSALLAVKGWKFSPGKKMGIPVTMWVDVPVRFELN
ncbi:MAG TPA: energy transducer TonB [Syntrophales bacterium]|nr:energy transducer TonB [Syntrophales bacterium]